MDRDVFIYDADSELTRRTVEWLRPRSDGSLDFRPLAETDPALLPDVDHDADAVVALVCADGRTFSGSLAIGEALRRSPKYDRNLLGRLLLEEPSKTVARWGYRWAAKNRLRLAGEGAR